MPYWKKTLPSSTSGFEAIPLSVADAAVTPLAGSVLADGGASSKAPMSHAGPCGLRTPRSSVAGHPLVAPASRAGLVAAGACVGSEPPLPCNGPSCGSVSTRSPSPLKPHSLRLSRLCPSETAGPEA